jgi:hypothetical protein
VATGSVDAAELAEAAAAAAGQAGVDDDVVALVGADVADAPRDPAAVEGTDSHETAVDGEGVEVERCVLVAACTEEVDNHTEDVSRRQVQSAGAPVRGVVGQGQAGLDETPLAAVENTGDSEESGMKPGGIIVNGCVARKGVPLTCERLSRGTLTFELFRDLLEVC